MHVLRMCLPLWRCGRFTFPGALSPPHVSLFSAPIAHRVSMFHGKTSHELDFVSSGTFALQAANPRIFSLMLVLGGVCQHASLAAVILDGFCPCYKGAFSAGISATILPFIFHSIYISFGAGWLCPFTGLILSLASHSQDSLSWPHLLHSFAIAWRVSSQL